MYFRLGVINLENDSSESCLSTFHSVTLLSNPIDNTSSSCNIIKNSITCGKREVTIDYFITIEVNIVKVSL